MAAIQTANYVRDTHQASLLLAQRADVRQAIEHKDWFPLEASLRQWATMNPHSDGVFLFSPDGGLLADGIGRGPNNSTRVAERDWFQAVLTTGQPSMGEPTASRGTGHAVVPLGIPVYDSHGSLQGIMVTSIALEALSEMLDSVHVDGETQATLIDLDRGLVLADPAQRQLITPNSVVDNARAQLGSDRGVLSTSLDGGTPVLAAMAPVPGLHWAVLVYEPTSTAFAPLAGMIGKTIGLTVLALVLAGACALMLVLWITAPIEQLRTAAMAMADGDLSRRARLDRRDEIGDLGMAFDAMADRLASTVRRLEEDVEARGRIEQELREGQQRLRAFFDAAPIGINVLDANARTIQANRALQDMIGYSEDELLGRTFSDYSDPDEQARDALAIREMRAGGREEMVRREKAYRHKNGDKVWVQITASTPRDEHGRPLFFVSMIENLSDRKRAQAALADSEQRNQAVLHAALDGIVTIDAQGVITELNPAAEVMFERIRHAAVGHHIAKLIELSEGCTWRAPHELVGQRIEAIAARADGS